MEGENGGGGGGYRLASDYPDVSFKKGKIPIFVIQVPISYPSPQMMGNLASKDWILKINIYIKNPTNSTLTLLYMTV